MGGCDLVPVTPPTRPDQEHLFTVGWVWPGGWWKRWVPRPSLRQSHSVQLPMGPHAFPPALTITSSKLGNSKRRCFSTGGLAGSARALMTPEQPSAPLRHTADPHPPRGMALTVSLGAAATALGILLDLET